MKIVKEKDITRYLFNLGINNFLKPAENRWLFNVKLENSEPGEFQIQILLSENSLVFISPFLPNLQGENLEQYYEILLRLTSYLDYLKFGISHDGKVITLQAEYSRINFTYSKFTESIQVFIQVYMECWLKLTELANDIGLEQRSSSNKSIGEFWKRFQDFRDKKEY